MKNASVIIFLLISLTSFVEKYWLEVDKYENILVVDGLLTNGDDPIIINLSTSSSINNNEYIPVSSGLITITDENHIETELTETTPGTYQVFNSTFLGQIGNSYQLHITLADGKNYISEICELLEPFPY